MYLDRSTLDPWWEALSSSQLWHFGVQPTSAWPNLFSFFMFFVFFSFQFVHASRLAKDLSARTLGRTEVGLPKRGCVVGHRQGPSSFICIYNLIFYFRFRSPIV